MPGTSTLMVGGSTVKVALSAARLGPVHKAQQMVLMIQFGKKGWSCDLEVFRRLPPADDR